MSMERPQQIVSTLGEIMRTTALLSNHCEIIFRNICSVAKIHMFSIKKEPLTPLIKSIVPREPHCMVFNLIVLRCTKRGKIFLRSYLSGFDFINKTTKANISCVSTSKVVFLVLRCLLKQIGLKNGLKQQCQKYNGNVLTDVLKIGHMGN